MIKGDHARRRRQAGRRRRRRPPSRVSNHGGNNLDGTPAPIRALPAVVEAVGDRHRDRARRRHPPGQRRREGGGPRRPGRHDRPGLPVGPGRQRPGRRRERPRHPAQRHRLRAARPGRRRRSPTSRPSDVLVPDGFTRRLGDTERRSAPVPGAPSAERDVAGGGGRPSGVAARRCRSGRPSSTGRTCPWPPTPTWRWRWPRRLAGGRPTWWWRRRCPTGRRGEHAGFPGTLSIGPAALELRARGAGAGSADAFAGVVLVSGHGGNAEAARPRRWRRSRPRAARARPGRRGSPAATPTPGAPRPRCCCALRPGVVRLEAGAAGATEPLAELLPALRAAAACAAVSPNGVLGDPAGASAEEGERLLDALAADLSRPSRRGVGR